MGQALFFYGTLRHLPLLEIVLGRSLDGIDQTPAVLEGHEVRATAQGPFPMIVPRAGGQAHGLRVAGLGAQDLTRLDYYEGGFDYHLTPVTLRGGAHAQMYLSREGAATPQGQWSLAAWEADWAELSCHAAREVMGHLGTLDRAQVAAMFPQIRARARSRVLASARPSAQGLRRRPVEVLEQRRAYTGFFAVDEMRLTHERFDGTRSAPMERSYFIGGDAALVLPYDPQRDRVMLVEQMRMGPLGRGDGEVWHLEPIAGRIDPGEGPEQAARREAREEAGLRLGDLEAVARGYASPGESTTYFHIYLGLADLPDTAAGLGGAADEQEDIRAHLMSFDAFFAMAQTHALANTPVTLLAYWLAHHRSRLRSHR